MPDQPLLRLGVIVPSANTVLEPDLVRAAPPGVRFHFTRVLNSEDTEEQLAGMRDEAGRAAWLLSHTGARAVAFGCTSGSFVKGLGYDREVVDLMERDAGIPCVTTSGCVIDALRAIGAHRVQLVAPYPDWLAKRAEAFLEASGFAVAGVASRDVPADRQGDVEPAEIAAWTRSGLQPGADAVFISCTNLRAMEVADALERETALPVVTSNQATLWGLLRIAGVTARIDGYGRVLRGEVGAPA